MPQCLLPSPVLEPFLRLWMEAIGTLAAPVYPQMAAGFSSYPCCHGPYKGQTHRWAGPGAGEARLCASCQPPTQTQSLRSSSQPPTSLQTQIRLKIPDPMSSSSVLRIKGSWLLPMGNFGGLSQNFSLLPLPLGHALLQRPWS